MRLDHAEDLAAFVEELKRETDRGLPLVSAALIDDKLFESLRAFFVEGKATERLLSEYSAPLGSFSARIDACFSLALIDQYEYSEISLIRKVRNEFAHGQHGLTFQTEPVRGFCSSLRSDLPEGAGWPTTDPRFRFTNAVVSMALRLYYRPEWVKKERRTPKEWVDPDATRWRSTEDEPPPRGVPVMGIGRLRDP